jgi:hypothetical protein
VTTPIAYWCNRDRDPFNVNDLFIAPASGGAGTNLTQVKSEILRNRPPLYIERALSSRIGQALAEERAGEKSLSRSG